MRINLRLHVILVLIASALMVQCVRTKEEVPQVFTASALSTAVLSVTPSPSTDLDSRVEEIDLSGTWMTNDRALVKIRQIGSSVTWEALSSYDEGKTFTHTFNGVLEGSVLDGHFYDHPPGMNRNSGDLVFRVISADRFELVSSVGSFGAYVFNRRPSGMSYAIFGHATADGPKKER